VAGAARDIVLCPGPRPFGICCSGARCGSCIARAAPPGGGCRSISRSRHRHRANRA